ncbi:MAG: hypothetical protein GY940_30160, partial [bacterium]|nr:hypothetical protein [bacterium]
MVTGDQNWSILQDKRGCIYVGNNDGLLEFDGVSWRKIIIPNGTVRSLALDDNTGTVYIGGRNELGFLTPDSQGTLQYKSLLNQLDKNKQNIGSVWNTLFTKEGIYFRTSNYLFKWGSGQLNVISETDNNHRFIGSFFCGSRLFIRKDKVGLMQLLNGSLELVTGGDTFASRSIFFMVPRDNLNLLIGAGGNGFYLYNKKDKTIVPFETRADDYFKRNRQSHGIRLRSGDFAVATQGGGLVIIDSQGRL